VQLLEQFVKAFPVLADVNAFGAGADYIHAAFVKFFCQLDGSPPAERYDNADGFFGFDNAHHVVNVQRFKVKPVRGIKIR